MRDKTRLTKGKLDKHDMIAQHLYADLNFHKKDLPYMTYWNRKMEGKEDATRPISMWPGFPFLTT